MLTLVFRDPSAKVSYAVISDVSFANRHAVEISWTKPQDIPQPTAATDVEVTTDPFLFTLRMTGIATPDKQQSEAFAATSALFHIFSSNSKEEKVGLRLPPIWRDLWTELAESKKSHADAQDRAIVKGLRDMVQKRQDRELEDGVILQGAFRGRGAAKSANEPSDTRSQDRMKQNATNADIYKKIWEDKSSTRSYQTMLVRFPDLRDILNGLALIKI